MASYNKGQLHQLELPDVSKIPAGLPLVFDDHSLAFSLGIRCKTLWWLLRKNTYENQKAGYGLYKSFLIQKRGGSKSKRLIHEPCAALKNVQKSILLTYLNVIPTEEHFGAYVPGRDLVYTAEKHVGQAVKISLDIKDFYPNTRRSWVREWLRTLGYTPWVVDTLSNLMVVPTKKGKHIRSVLPQGAPTSSSVSNHVAHMRLDTPILKYLQGLPFENVYTRYADNLEISFKTDLKFKTIDTIVDQLRYIVNTSGYRLNHRKTDIQRLASPDRPMELLGMTVNEKVNIPRQEYRTLRAAVHNCYCKGIPAHAEAEGFDSPEQLLMHLRGKLTYWSKVSPEKVAPLQAKFLVASEAFLQKEG